MLCKSIICMEQMIYIENQPREILQLTMYTWTVIIFYVKNDNFKVSSSLLSFADFVYDAYKEHPPPLLIINYKFWFFNGP